MLMGDLLLSIKESRSTSPALIPTAEDLSKVFPAGSTYVPSGLRQKIIVLSDTFALGWAGTRVMTSRHHRRGQAEERGDTLHERDAAKAL